VVLLHETILNDVWFSTDRAAWTEISIIQHIYAI